MVTLGVALIVGELANRMAWLTGGADGLQGVMPAKILGLFEFDLYGRNAYLYSLSVLFVLRLRAKNNPFPYGISLRASRATSCAQTPSAFPSIVA